MKRLPYLSFACAAVLGTGLLFAADEPQPNDPPPPVAAGDQPPSPPERNNNPPPPPADRPPRRGNNQPPDGRDGDFRPFNGGGQSPHRPNGPQGPQDGREDGRRPFANQPAPMKLQAYLGVVTRGAGPDIAAQLKLGEGFGLIVEDVLPESPAAAAGVQPNDLLRLLDDQLLVNPAQLEALVRRAGKDKEVTLTLLREGTEQKVTVKIGEKMMPVRRPMANAGGGGDFFPQGNPAPRPVRDGNRPYDDYRAGPPRDDASFDRDTRYATDRARVVRRDDSGTYEIARGNGTRIFSAKKPDGTLIWKGPVETEEDRQAMPEEVRKKFTEIESSRPLDRLGERPLQPYQPGGEGPDGLRSRPFGPGEPGRQRPQNLPPEQDNPPR